MATKRKKTSAAAKKKAASKTVKKAAAKKKAVKKSAPQKKKVVKKKAVKRKAVKKSAATKAKAKTKTKAKAKAKAKPKKTAKKTAVKKKVASKPVKKKPAKKKAVKKKAVKKKVAKKAGKKPAVKKAAKGKVAKKSPAKKQAKKQPDAGTAIASRRTPEPVFTPYKAQRNEEYMNEPQKDHFRQILLDWKQQLMEEVDRTMGHMQDEAAHYPDPADRASQEEEFSLELKARDRERKLIRKIDNTLDLIDQDDYGYCESCGVEIGVKRLEARPTATQCIDCKTLDEIKERQLHG